MRVLIGCPTHECKAYAAPAYIAAVAAQLDAAACLLLLVDNSPTPDFAAWLRAECRRARVPARVVHLSGLPQGDYDSDDMTLRLGASREAIRRELLAGGWDAWWSLEADVIAPPGLLALLLRHLPEADAVYHVYPARHDPYWDQEGMGCVLLRPAVVADFPFDDGPGLTGGDVALNRRVLLPPSPYRAVRLHNYLPVRHLEA